MALVYCCRGQSRYRMLLARSLPLTPHTSFTLTHTLSVFSPIEFRMAQLSQQLMSLDRDEGRTELPNWLWWLWAHDNAVPWVAPVEKRAHTAGVCVHLHMDKCTSTFNCSVSGSCG